MSAVATFIGFEQAETFKRHLSAMCSAAKYCTEAGLSGQLSKELKNAGIFRQCELFVHSQPWKRHPAALTLKKIFAFLMVLFFVSSLSIELNHHAFRTVDIPASMNPMLTQDLKLFGVPSSGRLYQTPMLLRRDCAYSMSS